jgi:hypothetical protein
LHGFAEKEAGRLCEIIHNCANLTQLGAV